MRALEIANEASERPADLTFELLTGSVRLAKQRPEEAKTNDLQRSHPSMPPSPPPGLLFTSTAPRGGGGGPLRMALAPQANEQAQVDTADSVLRAHVTGYPELNADPRGPF